MRKVNSIDTLLARFPGPVTLTPSRFKLWLGPPVFAHAGYQLTSR